MDQIVYLLKRHRRSILRVVKKVRMPRVCSELTVKAFRAFRRKKPGAFGAGAGMGAGMGAATMQQPPPGAGYGPPPGPGYMGPPGGQAPNTYQILGPHDIHEYDDNNKNAQNPYYKDLRNRARSEGDKMANAFQASKQAYNSGNGARAKQLSEEGQAHKMQMERLNSQAAEWIYAANNDDSPPGTTDLHGLYTNEAIVKAEQVIQQAQAQGYPQLRIIVGKGLHSKNHVQHLRPAVERLVQQYNISAHVDKRNTGVLVVDLQSPRGAGNVDFVRDMISQGTGGNQDVRPATVRPDRCLPAVCGYVTCQ